MTRRSGRLSRPSDDDRARKCERRRCACTWQARAAFSRAAHHSLGPRLSCDDGQHVNGPTCTPTPAAHDSKYVLVPRVRRKRQRLRPNGSIESDPTVNVRPRSVRPRAGLLPNSTALDWSRVTIGLYRVTLDRLGDLADGVRLHSVAARVRGRRRRRRPWGCALAQRSAILVIAYQGATVSAERTASTWNVKQHLVSMNSFLPERADTGRIG
jgi:hypothetical protein